MEKKRNFGLALLLSMLVLALEGALALVVTVIYSQTQPSKPGEGGVALFVIVFPLLATAAAAAAAALSVAFVLPTAWLSGVLGRRFGGREAWWWVLPVAAAAALVLVGAATALSGGGQPAAVAGWWLLLTAAFAVAARLTRSRRQRIFGPVTLWGASAVVVTAVLGGVALSTGVLRQYEPPEVTPADLLGSWSNGKGGTLTLTAGGLATVTAVGDEADGSDGGRSDSCTGQGTWRFTPGENTWKQEVDVHVEACPFAPWTVGGTASRLTLYQYVGDPDAGEVYELRRTGGGS
ncbi:hypothetical protein [Streptomyces sp. NPDC059452]|uniref:hypothetical protein n=1 Tax=Streptomyces sp. NPDC059452 TaxID=3346835 RepID=UPI00367F313D